MSVGESIFLGILQGITEFLPVSSSGHLVLFQNILGIKTPEIFFDTMVHFGTFFAILFFFFQNIKHFLKDLIKEIKGGEGRENINFFLYLIVGTLPIVILGILLQEKIDEIFNSLRIVGFSFLFTSLILFLTYFFQKQKKIVNLNFINSFFIGLFQAVALFPGVSRSGVTISAGIFSKIDKEKIFQFSFYLGAIAILGATIMQIPEIQNLNQNQIIASLIGFLVSLLVGYFALVLLKRVFISNKFYLFGFYTLIAGIICFLL